MYLYGTQLLLISGAVLLIGPRSVSGFFLQESRMQATIIIAIGECNSPVLDCSPAVKAQFDLFICLLRGAAGVLGQGPHGPGGRNIWGAQPIRVSKTCRCNRLRYYCLCYYCSVYSIFV